MMKIEDNPAFVFCKIQDVLHFFFEDLTIIPRRGVINKVGKHIPISILYFLKPRGVLIFQKCLNYELLSDPLQKKKNNT